MADGGVKQKKISVSLSIVCYNSKYDIVDCLDSLNRVLDKSKIDLSIFIIDNNSVDDSVKFLKKKYQNVTFILNDKNFGYGAGHNSILSLINSDYHLILNPDVIFKEDAILKLVNFLNENNDVVMTTPEIRNVDGSIQHLPKKYPKLKYVISSTLPFLSKYRAPYTMSDVKIDSPIQIDICTGSFMMIRTDILKKINGFDEDYFMYFEDFDLSVRASKFGKIIFNPSTYIVHKWNRDSKKSKRMFMIQLQSCLLFFRKRLI